MTELIFIRHFETDVDDEIPAEMWDLSENGRKTMEKFIEKRNFKEIDKILTSSEKKAKITAEAISEKSGCPMEVLDEITEVERRGGFIEKQEDYFAAVKSLLETGTYENWETRSHAEERLEEFLEKAKGHEKVIAISHGMILTILLSDYFEMEPYKFWKQLEFGEEIKVDLESLMEVFCDD